LAEVPVRLQKRILNHVRGIDFSLEPAADVQAGQQGQVLAVQFQQPPHIWPLPARARRNSSRGSALVYWLIAIAPPKLGAEAGPIVPREWWIL
jgi:hypothetical protein